MEVVMVPEGPGQPRRVLARPAKARARARPPRGGRGVFGAVLVALVEVEQWHLHGRTCSPNVCHQVTNILHLVSDSLSGIFAEP